MLSQRIQFLHISPICVSYSSREPHENFWAGIRLPVGYLRMETLGNMTGGQLRLNLWNGDITGTITTTLGTYCKWSQKYTKEPIFPFPVQGDVNHETGR
eukprot:m.257793 g.257793  ORF g.257793 m.257793 type:complete len:99 (-) comp16191_c1_seq50:452-748(-)